MAKESPKPTYEVYSRAGRLLDSLPTIVEAERKLGVWFNAAYVIEVDAKGNRKTVRERKELDHV